MPSLSPSRYRRRILGLGALATGALYVIGAPFYVRGIEDDLEQRVPMALADAGFDGVLASFTGQDGALTCRRPLDDPEGAIAAAYDVRGVRAVELDRSCRVNRAADDVEAAVPTTSTPSEVDEPSAATPLNTTATSVASDGDAGLLTVHDIVAANPDLGLLSVLLDDVDLDVDEPFTLLAPTNAAFDAVPADQLAVLQADPALLQRVLLHHVVPGGRFVADLVDGELVAADGTSLVVVTGDRVAVGGAALVDVDIEASNGVVHMIDGLLLPDDVELVDAQAPAPVAVTWDGETTVLSGVVASEVERQLVVAAAVDAFGLGAVIDEMIVDPDIGLDQATAERLAILVAAMPGGLRSGEVGFDGDDLYANGVYRTEESRGAFVEVAASVDADTSLNEPPRATAEQAAALEDAINEFVTANPILFEPTSSVLAGSSGDVLDRVASEILSLDGVLVVVEGHTDSDGQPDANLGLSEARAAAVRDALIARGVDATVIEATGLGSQQPVLIDGVEDKSASRRVEFRVSAEVSG